MIHSHRKGKCSYEDITNQLVRNNKYILNDGKSLYHAFFHNTCGIRKVGDLVSKGNIFPRKWKNSQFKTNCKSIFPLIGSGQRHTKWMAFHHQGKKCSCWTVSFHWKFVSSANKGKGVWSFKNLLQNTLQRVPFPKKNSFDHSG